MQLVANNHITYTTVSAAQRERTPFGPVRDKQWGLHKGGIEEEGVRVML